jgi:glutaredoxin 3
VLTAKLDQQPDECEKGCKVFSRRHLVNSAMTIYSTRVCPYCVSAKKLFMALGIAFTEIGLDDKPELRDQLSRENRGWRTVPMIFLGSEFLGGFDDVNKLHREGKLLLKIESLK